MNTLDIILVLSPTLLGLLVVAWFAHVAVKRGDTISTLKDALFTANVVNGTLEVSRNTYKVETEKQANQIERLTKALSIAESAALALDLKGVTDAKTDLDRTPSHVASAVDDLLSAPLPGSSSRPGR